MTRAEHLAWAKARALAYCDRGEFQQALASIGSDLEQHEALRNHPAIQLGMMMLLTGHLSSPDAMRRFIEGIN